jgi:hypothetical protein
VRRGYRLGLICNTLYTGGEVLRQALRCLGLHNAVQVLVFLDEVGIHVGDIDELDVGGAPLAVRSRKVDSPVAAPVTVTLKNAERHHVQQRGLGRAVCIDALHALKATGARKAWFFNPGRLRYLHLRRF